MESTLRGPQHRPLKADVAAAWGRIRAAAISGDIQANAFLIALVENKPIFRAPDLQAPGLSAR